MRIAKNTEIIITDAPTYRFLLVIDVMDGDVTLDREGETILHIRLDGEDVLATVNYPDGRSKTLHGLGAKNKEVILTSGYARMGLYVNGALYDEDFFYTPIDYKDARVAAGSFMHFEAGYEYHSADESAIVEKLTDSLDGYRLKGYAHTLFRVIPTAVGDKLSLMYFDGRSHMVAGKDKDAHKLSAMFSEDGRVFHGAPIALGIDNVREEDLLDAALLKRDGRYYLYYIVRYTTHRALAVSVSEDGFSFIKTGLDVEICGVNNADISSVSILDGETPRLYFVVKGSAYYAESIDLLHFSAPVSLGIDGIDKIFPLPDGTLFAEKAGVLYKAENGALTPVKNAPLHAAPVLYRGELLYIGIESNAFSVRKM